MTCNYKLKFPTLLSSPLPWGTLTATTASLIDYVIPRVCTGHISEFSGLTLNNLPGECQPTTCTRCRVHVCVHSKSLAGSYSRFLAACCKHILHMFAYLMQSVAFLSVIQQRRDAVNKKIRVSCGVCVFQETICMRTVRECGTSSYQKMLVSILFC